MLILILLVLTSAVSAQTMTCPHPLGHSDYCQDCGPCAEGVGDCDNDEQCEDDLTCIQVEGTDFCQPLRDKIDDEKSVSFGWDPNKEEGLVGYRFYYGKQSRFDESLDPVARTAELVEKNCYGNQECIDSWYDYCTDPKDQMCDYDWFDYDTKIDVGNVTEYTVTLPAGTYFFAISAYDNEYEGKFSEELTQIIELGAPGKPLNFKGMKAIN